MIVLENYGVQVKGALFDTMIAHYVLQPELRHGMDYLAEIYLHYQTIHIDELIGAKGKTRKTCVISTRRMSTAMPAKMQT